MSQYFQIHPENPQSRLISKAVSVLKAGGVIVYPTDSAYALGCQIGNKEALNRIRAIRELNDKHNFTLVCSDLSEISTYARVDNPAYRFLKTYTPGPFTFILTGSKELPKRVLHPKRKTIGVRIPDHPIVHHLLEELKEPIMSVTLIMPRSDTPLIEPEAMKDLLGGAVDLIIDGQYCGIQSTTVVDLTDSSKPEVLRQGKGEIELD